MNGVMERYMLYLSEMENELGTVVYNNSDLFLDYIITNLTAGTTYYVTLSVSYRLYLTAYTTLHGTEYKL